MEMDYVKLVGAAKHLLQEQNVMRHLVHAVLVQAQGAWARGNESGLRHRVTTGEEGHLVALADQLFREVGDDPLGPPVVLWRYALVERSNLGDTDTHSGAS